MRYLLFLIVAASSLLGCASTSQTENSEFRLVADRALMYLPEAKELSYFPISEMRFNRNSTVSAGEVAFYVDSRSEIKATNRSGVWQIEVPDNAIQLQNSCYVAFDGKSIVPIRARKSTVADPYAVSLRAAAPLVAARDNSDVLSESKRNIQERITSTRRAARLAETSLSSDPLYKSGECTKPNVGLPIRPQNAIGTRAARMRADSDASACIRERVGCDIGAETFTRSLGLPSISSMPAGYVCGQMIDSGVCPKDGLTDLANLAQGLVAGCMMGSGEDSSFFSMLGCAVVYKLVNETRHTADSDSLYARYISPYSRWQDEVRRIESGAANQFLSCQTKVDTIAEAPVSLSKFSENLSKIEEHQKSLQQVISDNRPIIWKGETTACDKLSCEKRGSKTFCGLKSGSG